MNTATATFHSLRGEKSALIMVKANVLEFSASPVYVPRTGLEQLTGIEADKLEEGHTFEIPGGFTLVDIVDIESGEVRTTKDGTPLKQLRY